MLLGVVFCAQMSRRLKRYRKSLLLPPRNRCVHYWVCWVFTGVTFLGLLQWLLLSPIWPRKVVAHAAPFTGLQIAPVLCRRSKICWATSQFCCCLDWISHLCFRPMPVRPVWEQFCFKSLRIVYNLCALPVTSFWIGRNGTAPLSANVSIVRAVHKFVRFLWEVRFVLQTDHPPLTYLRTSNFKNSRIMRWALSLQEFSFEVLPVSGQANVFADLLSPSAVDQVIPWLIIWLFVLAKRQCGHCLFFRRRG